MEISDVVREFGLDDIGEFSDGYHTFNQLYHQRAVLFATIVNQNPDIAWKSLRHADGKFCFDREGEWFILYKFKEQNLKHIINKLDVLNPMNTLKRGYAIIKKDKKVISDSQNLQKDDIINIDIRDGSVNAKVMEVSYGKH